MSMHEKHTLKDNDKRTTTIKQRQNSQATTQKREQEDITDQEELLLLAETELLQCPCTRIHSHKDKSTTANKQRKNNAQATTESETENITDQEELLLLAETELVQGGEEQLWELFLPLSPLLPANIIQLYYTTHYQLEGRPM